MFRLEFRVTIKERRILGALDIKQMLLIEVAKFTMDQNIIEYVTESIEIQ